MHSEALLADMQGDVNFACSRKAGMLYITDDVFDINISGTNPWDYLATYWNDFIATIEMSTCYAECSDDEGSESSESSDSSDSDDSS